jgi:hypothetical protein
MNKDRGLSQIDVLPDMAKRLLLRQKTLQNGLRQYGAVSMPGQAKLRMPPRFRDYQTLESEMAFFQKHCQQRPGEPPQAGFKPKPAELQAFKRPGDVLADRVHDSEEQAVLAAVESVDVRLRAADFAHDIIDADAIVAPRQEQLRCAGAKLPVARLPPPPASCLGAATGLR